ncbi:C-type lysozyme, inhibitor [Salinicola aestuarinus]|uniref:C-type lysozyme, inhibitor n=1 Tax=Salinicola aestuarinus TaxID=1949082 RepID=UPI000DA18740|nr:C-type lysozyme, inhibitor [Salinicola aestuarinus]
MSNNKPLGETAPTAGVSQTATGASVVSMTPPQWPLASRRTRGFAAATLALAALLSGCAGGTTQTVDATSPLAVADDAPQSPLLPSLFFADGGETFANWRCTPSRDLVTTAPDDRRLRLWTAQGGTQLPRAASGSAQQRYTQGGLSFKRLGRDALVESDSARLVCTLAGERRTVTREDRPESIFYASGSDPGWNISLDRRRTTLTLISDYGQAKDTFDYRVASLRNGAGAEMVLVSDSGRRPLEMHLTAKACFDSVTRKPWPVEVTLRYGRQEWKGCGQGVEAKG